jgi:hypothetical protein
MHKTLAPGMTTIQVSRTLVKSAPELWAQVCAQDFLAKAGGTRITHSESERSLGWEARGSRGTCTLEPTSWGTKVTFTAEIDESAQRQGFFSRIFRKNTKPPTPEELDHTLASLLDDLGASHRRPVGL